MGEAFAFSLDDAGRAVIGFLAAARIRQLAPVSDPYPRQQSNRTSASTPTRAGPAHSGAGPDLSAMWSRPHHRTIRCGSQEAENRL